MFASLLSLNGADNRAFSGCMQSLKHLVPPVNLVSPTKSLPSKVG